MSKRAATSATGASPPLHQPRQHHQQPAQPLLAGRGPRRTVGHDGPRRGEGVEPGDEGGPHCRRAEDLGVLEQPEHPRPEGELVAARHSNVDRAVRLARTTAAVAELAHHGARPARRRPAPAPWEVARPVAELLGIVGERPWRTSKSAGTLERAGGAGLDVAVDAVDPERAHRPRAVVVADDVPEALAQQQAVRVEVPLAGRGSRSARSLARCIAVAEHRQRFERRQRRRRRGGCLAAPSPPSFQSATAPHAVPRRTAATASCRAARSSAVRSSSASS